MHAPVDDCSAMHATGLHGAWHMGGTPHKHTSRLPRTHFLRPVLIGSGKLTRNREIVLDACLSRKPLPQFINVASFESS